MAVDSRISASRSAWPTAGSLTGGETTGNERLTAAAGALLIVLLAVIGATIIERRPLLSVHLFVGTLLIGPVALKLGSTGYRFIRYYTGNPRYRSKGAPPLPLRLIAPIIVISTVVVLASGVALLFAGPSSRGTLLPIHKLSFIVWLAFTAVHVLSHLPTVGRALRGDYGRSVQWSHDASGSQWSRDANGRLGRALALGGALIAGTVLAILVIPQFGPWLHAQGVFNHH
jgi:hypothetical protein